MPIALNIRGCVYFKRKEFDKAIDDFSEVLHLDPQNFSAIDNRSLSYFERGDFEKAIGDDTVIIQTHPKFAPAYPRRATAYSKCGKFTEATNDFSKAIQINPQYADAYNGFAWLLATCPDASIRNGMKAVELAQKACTLTDWKKGYYIDTLAAAYAEAGDFEQAVENEKKALKIGGPNDKERSEEQQRLILFQQRKQFHESYNPTKQRAPKFANDLHRAVAAFVGADAPGVVDGGDEDLAVADLAGLGGLDDGFDGGSTTMSGRTISILILGRKSTVYSLPR